MEQNSVVCPSCKTKIRLDKKLFKGFFFFCDECEAELEVVQLNPLVVSEVIEEYEDFDDEFDDEDFDYDEDMDDFEDDDYDFDDDD